MIVALALSVLVNLGALLAYLGRPIDPRSPKDIERIETLDRIVRKWETWASLVPDEHRPAMWKPNELVD